MDHVDYEYHLWTGFRNEPTVMPPPMIMLLMVILSTWPSHSTTFIFYHLRPKGSYFTIFEKINLNQLTPPSIITFGPQKVQEICQLQCWGKCFSIFTLDLHRSYPGQPPISVLNFQPIYNSLKLSLKWWQSENLSYIYIYIYIYQFYHRTDNLFF